MVCDKSVDLVNNMTTACVDEAVVKLMFDMIVDLGPANVAGL